MDIEVLIAAIQRYPGKWFEDSLTLPFPRNHYTAAKPANYVVMERVRFLPTQNELIRIIFMRSGKKEHFRYVPSDISKAAEKYNNCMLILRADELLAD